MTTTTVNDSAQVTVQPISGDDVWTRLDGLRRGEKLPPPLMIQVFEHRSVDIRLACNERGHTNRWAQTLGLAVPRMSGIFDNAPGERWFSYRTKGFEVAQLLPGWTVYVWCSVDVDVDASAHWDGLILHRNEHGRSQRCFWIGGCQNPLIPASSHGLCADHLAQLEHRPFTAGDMAAIAAEVPQELAPAGQVIHTVGLVKEELALRATEAGAQTDARQAAMRAAGPAMRRVQVEIAGRQDSRGLVALRVPARDPGELIDVHVRDLPYWVGRMTVGSRVYARVNAGAESAPDLVFTNWERPCLMPEPRHE